MEFWMLSATSNIVSRKHLIAFSIMVSAASLLSSCGNKSATRVVTTRPSQTSGDAKNVDSRCIDYSQCPRLALSLAGRSNLGGEAGKLMTWDIGALASQDEQRETVVVMDNTLSGMDIFSKPTDKILRVNWKPESAQQGELRFRARDMTRCRIFAAQYGGDCNDLNVAIGEFDTVFKSPFQVVAKGQIFQAENSDFFRQFNCKNLQSGQKAAQAVGAGSSILTGATSGDGLGSQGDNVSVLIDYFIDGRKKPTPYECMSRGGVSQ
jgi:hypothetical protein